MTDDLFTRNDDSSLRTKLTVKGLKVKSGISLLLATEGSCLVPSGSKKVARRRAPRDVKKLVKAIGYFRIILKTLVTFLTFVIKFNFLYCSLGLLGKKFSYCRPQFGSIWAACSVSILLK